VRSIAKTSFASPTTQISAASRRGSAHVAHGSSSVIEKQRPHSRTRSLSAMIASARASASDFGRLSRWKTSRAAVFGPIVGSLLSSLISA
jgi:hypothetical protein